MGIPPSGQPPEFTVNILFLPLLIGCSKQTDEVTVEVEANYDVTSNFLPGSADKTKAARIEYDHKIFGTPCDPFAALSEDQKVYRFVEIDYPKGDGHVITPTSFDDIVSPQVVRDAMSIYACTNHMNDQRDLSASVLGVGRGHDLSIEGLSYFARTMAYVHLGLDSLAQTDGPAYFTAGDVARNIVREHLKNPETLKEVYRDYKPILIEGVNKAQAPEPIRTYLNEAIPYFTQPIPENVLEAERALLAAEAKCEGLEWEKGGEQCYETEYTACQALIAVTPDYRVLQWMHRRQAEGGDALVQAWGEILVDFSHSL